MTWRRAGWWTRSSALTDEDVERVAETLNEELMRVEDRLPPGEGLPNIDETRLARAALSAYLEPTTKGDT
jgi:hypothetical protein